MKKKPKICFFLHRRFTALGHSIALHLKEKYAIEHFCAYVSGRGSFDFLRAQKDIAYTALVLDEDVRRQYKKEALDMDYLRALEQTYGMPNLWTYLAADRVLMHNQMVREYPYDKPPYPYKDMLLMLQVTARSIIAFLEKERPDVLCTSQALSGLGNLLLYSIAQKKGIPTWTICQTGVKHRWAWSSHHITLHPVEERFRERVRSRQKDLYDEEAREMITVFRREPEPYYSKLQPSEQAVDRKKQFRFLLPHDLFRSLSFFGRILYRHVTGNERSDFSYITPWHYFIDHAKRKLRNLIGVSDLYDSVDTKEHFAFFPLQTEPETSLAVWAPYKTNQLEVVRQVARSLPIDYMLYVKEHPLMAEYRPRAYYKELKKIPNVKLIDPAVSGFDLLAHTTLLVTITGTLGLQAAFFGKPTITLGEISYNCLSFVEFCREMETLPRVIKKQLTDFRYNEEELIAFVAAILENSASLNYVHLWEEASDMAEKKKGVEPLANLLARRLGLIGTV